MKRTRLALLLVLGMVAALLPMGMAPAAADPPADLFMSEYVEGSSYNKAIEIYNGTGADVDLAAGVYTLELYSNGADTASQTLALSGVVADGDVFVLANSQADPAVTAVADEINNPVINFNGDDSVVLRKNGAVVDAFGQIAADPGDEWVGGGQNDTLRRMADVCAGDTNADDAFDASVEWNTFASNTFDDLGSHTADCGGAPPVAEIVINEVDSDTPGTDAAEFVELYDGGAGSTALDGLVVVFYNGSNDLSYAAYDLDGFSTDADGYFVLGNAGVSGVDVVFASNGLQNGADAVAVYAADGADFPSGTAVSTDELIDAVVYDTSDSDDAGLLVLLNAGQPQVNEGGSGDKDNHSNQRCPNGSGGARNTDSIAQAAATPSADNGCAAPIAEVIINEVDSDTPGTDVLEFVELYDGGAGGTALDGLVVVFYNGSDDASYDAFDLDGFSTDSDGFFVLGNTAVDGVDVVFSSNGLQNGADAVAVHAGDASDFPIDTPVTTDELIDAVVYDTNDGDDAGLLVLLNASQPQVNEDGAGNKDNHSNQRCPNGSGGALNTDTIEQWAPTPAAENVCVAPVAEVKIHDVQGPGDESPLEGQTVIIEGIVVGDFQDDVGANGDMNGFFVQEEDADADADPLTSEGIFVYNGSDPTVDVAIGDLVQLEGSVSEYYDMTQISSFSDDMTVLSSGNPLPTAAILALPVTSLNDFEPTEGMYVTFPDPLIISEYYNYGRYGEIVLTSDRFLTPTAEFEPGPDAVDAAAEYLLNRITLDDGRTAQNPDPARHPNGLEFDLSNLFRGGDEVANATGVLNYSFSLWRIQPTQGADYTAVNHRTAAPDAVGGNLTVASFNVLNYFTTLDDGTNDICGPSGTLECRGADTAEELERQRAKIISALSTMDADVVGLIEIENNRDDDINNDAVNDLVVGLNDASGAGTYAYIDTGAIGDDAIKVAYIYKPATVSPVGDYAILDESVDPRFIDAKNRPVLAQTFMDDTSGGVFTVAVNHLKSKGSNCDALGDPDLDDGAGNCNLTRTAAAEALVDWLAGDPTNSGDDDFLIIGDLNSYDKEDPIDAILAGGYTDLIYDYLGEDAYSYVFDGQVGYLDHALANDALVDEVTGVTVWHINADEASLIDYDMSYKQDAQDAINAPDAYRSSDHDPVIVGLELEANPNYLKTESIGALEALLPTGSRYYDKLINRAIGNIEDSLNPAYWEDDFHLTKRGNKVFDEERRAVWDLMRVRGAAEAGADAVIEALVEADMVLAGTAIDDAIAAEGSAWWIARAEKEMKRAQYDSDRNRPDKAIGHYKRAWQYSQKAISGCHFGRSFGHMFG